jgi:hypothetical protein
MEQSQSSESFQRRVCRADDLRHSRTRARNCLDRARDLKQRQAFEVSRGRSQRRVGAELVDRVPILPSDPLAKSILRSVSEQALCELLSQAVRDNANRSISP